MTKPFKYIDFKNYSYCWVKYEGTFEKGLRHGKGILTLSNAEIFTGEWV